MLLHLQNAYARLGYGVRSFPVAEKTSAEIVSRPMFPGLVGLAQERVVDRSLPLLRECAVMAKSVLSQ